VVKYGKSNLSDYKLISLLGEGSYGKVYKCEHKESGLLCAIKEFKTDDYQ